jgi:hypothetical protein
MGEGRAGLRRIGFGSEVAGSPSSDAITAASAAAAMAFSGV